MTKRILSILSLIMLPYLIMAQLQHSKAKLSPLTKMYLSAQQKNVAIQANQENYIRKEINGKTYLSALIKVNGNVDLNKLSVLGIITGTKAGNIWTVQIPAESMKELPTVNGIDYIELDEPIYLNLDSARRATHVDSVHQGISLPQAFTGKNVVVGIIDAGFDYSHPTLLDTSGTLYRVKKVWEQKNTGTPPAGYIYGNEIADSLSLWSDGNDISTFSHGTHVTGIAAGSGIGSSANNHRFRGIAFGSDIVLVGIRPEQGEWTSTGLSSIIDGMAYIFQYAASVGKPAVVNLSWGCSVGPHDGGSLFSQAVDQLTGPGKIFVCAAGNNGSDNIHLHKNFTSADTLLRSCISFSPYLSQKKTWVDAWGQAGKTFCAAVTLYSGTTAGATTGFICPDDSLHSFYLKGTDNDTCFVSIAASPVDCNGNPRAFFDVYSKTGNRVMISIKADTGSVNVWMGYVKDYTGYYGSFNMGGIVGNATGNRDMTVSDIATTHSAISAAAYSSKTSFISIDGAPTDYNYYVTKGNIAPFSSHGPAADSVTKPDIAAPGLVLGSAINSFDTSYYTGGPNRTDVIVCYNSPLNGKDYCYAMMMGTSMASPMVTGIVALILQAKPNLNPQQVKDVLWLSAIQDNYTGTIPSTGSNIWGYGKINAYTAVKLAWLNGNIQNIASPGLDFMIYPVPNNGNFNLDFISADNDKLNIEIMDVPGKTIWKETWKVSAGFNTRGISMKPLAKGIYFIKLSNSKAMSVFKMVVGG